MIHKYFQDHLRVGQRPKKMKTYKQFKEQITQEQLVVPRGLKYPGMSAKSEMDVLKRLSNRKTVFDKAVTGRRIPGISEP